MPEEPAEGPKPARAASSAATTSAASDFELEPEPESDDFEEGPTVGPSTALRRRGFAKGTKLGRTRRWTSVEDGELWDSREQDPPVPYKDIASSLQRSRSACQNRYSELATGPKLKPEPDKPAKRTHRRWTPEEDQQLRNGVAANLTFAEIAAGLGRTTSSVQKHYCRL